MPDLVTEKCVWSDGVQVHIPAYGNQLRPREIVQSKVILEEFADLDDIRL